MVECFKTGGTDSPNQHPQLFSSAAIDLSLSQLFLCVHCHYMWDISNDTPGLTSLTSQGIVAHGGSLSQH